MPPADADRSGRLRCLIIEDDPVARALAAAACAGEDMAVDAPDDLAGVVALSLSTRYHLVILDHQLTEDLGLQLLEQLAAPIYRAQFILITAERDAAVVDRYRRLGIQQVLHKPFSRADLARLVRVALAEVKPWE